MAERWGSCSHWGCPGVAGSGGGKGIVSQQCGTTVKSTVFGARPTGVQILLCCFLVT